MAELVYLSCVATSAACAWLLIRTYLRTRARLLLWSSVCFAGLALNNMLLFVDLVLVPGMDLSLVRGLIALGAVGVLIVGLVLDVR
jgi:hypothetical protein